MHHRQQYLEHFHHGTVVTFECGAARLLCRYAFFLACFPHETGRGDSGNGYCGSNSGHNHGGLPGGGKDEGVATPEDIDLACRLGLGHPIGPFQLLDATQNSLSLQVQGILHDAYGERFKPRPLLKQMVQAGYNGKKAGRGWYQYDKKG